MILHNIFIELKDKAVEEPTTIPHIDDDTEIVPITGGTNIRRDEGKALRDRIASVFE